MVNKDMSTRIQKPMLAVSLPEGHSVQFPVLATPKIDGIRALMIDGTLVSRTFKPIKNRRIRELLEKYLPNGADGEIMYGSTFQECTSMVMTLDACPDIARLKFYWFDYVKDSANRPYELRVQDIQCHALQDDIRDDLVNKLLPRTIRTSNELSEYEAQCVAQGYEGVMLRSKDGPYKFGRATLKEGFLLKMKRFADSDACIEGFEELLHNNNNVHHDAFGLCKRSSHKINKAGAGTLGALLVRDVHTGVSFNIGTGFDAQTRHSIWMDRDNLVGKLIKYKSMPHGVKDAPRHPVFLGFRDECDL